MLAKIQDSIFKEVPNASIVFFRIVFGILGFADVMGHFAYYHLYKNAYDTAGFQFKYYGFQWVHPLPEPFMFIFFILMLSAAIAIIIGWRYRVATAIFALGFIMIFLLEKAHYLNHGYLFCILSVLMIFIPANKNFSFDVLQNRIAYSTRIPFYYLLLLTGSMAVVYFYGGIAKLNADWLQAIPLKQWVSNKRSMPLLGWIWEKEITAWFMAYGGLFLDLFVVFFLLFRRTRIYALLAVIFFHTVNCILFKIGIFPFLSLALTLLFFSPDAPLSWIKWLNQKIPFTERWTKQWEVKVANKSITPLSKPKNRKLILGLLSCYFLLHLIIPFRHHYFEGDVAWTEEGHRYSWRMMLRSKQGYGSFTVVDSETKESYKVRPAKDLGKRQLRKMYTHPDMILQYAHHLRDKAAMEGVIDPKVYAEIKVKLNYRRYQTFVDPAVDLAKEEWNYFSETDWVKHEVIER